MHAPATAIQSVGRTPIVAPSAPPAERAERADALVHERMGAGDPCAERVRDERGAEGAARAVEDDEAEPGARLRGGEADEHCRAGTVGERDERERRGERDRPGEEGAPGADPAREGPGDRRARQAAERPGAEHQPERHRRHVERPHRVEQEERSEGADEEVERRERAERRPQHRLAGEEA